MKMPKWTVCVWEPLTFVLMLYNIISNAQVGGLVIVKGSGFTEKSSKHLPMTLNYCCYLIICYAIFVVNLWIFIYICGGKTQVEPIKASTSYRESWSFQGLSQITLLALNKGLDIGNFAIWRWPIVDSDIKWNGLYLPKMFW